MAGKNPQTRTWNWLYAILLGVMVGTLFYCSWINNRTVIRGYELNDLRAEERHLLEEQDKLQAELATLLRPQNLARLARKLGLREPQVGHKVVLP